MPPLARFCANLPCTCWHIPSSSSSSKPARAPSLPSAPPGPRHIRVPSFGLQPGGRQGAIQRERAASIVEAWGAPSGPFGQCGLPMTGGAVSRNRPYLIVPTTPSLAAHARSAPRNTLLAKLLPIYLQDVAVYTYCRVFKKLDTCL